MDGQAISGDTFTLNKNVSVSGVFYYTDPGPGLSETLPALTVGTTAATIVKDVQNSNILNVSITIPNGAAASQIALSDGTNFTFADKTFNFDITFASGVYDEDTVNAITGKFVAKGANTGTTITTPVKPQEPPAPQPATLKIDGVDISIPVPIEGVNVIDVSAVVSGGAVTEFSDSSGILAGKTINLTLSAPDGQDKINYSAISAIENAFKSKGASPLSNTAGGAIPVFNSASMDDNLITTLASRAPDTPNAGTQIVNNIQAFNDNGSKILKVQSPMQLTGEVFLTELAKVQADAGMVHADETLRLAGASETERETTLASFLNAYEKCGFDLSGENNFLPKPGFMYQGSDWYISITDTASSWDIYKLFERYHDKDKLSSLTGLHAQNITVAGENATGLYDADSQPSASFPYKVNGEIIGFMKGNFKSFENMYEDGTNPIPNFTTSFGHPIKVKNFATKSELPNVEFQAEGACFFQYAPGVVNSAGAVKFMQTDPDIGIAVTAKYIDLRTLTRDQTRAVHNHTLSNTDEIAFSSLISAPQTYDERYYLDYDTGYYVDDGVTKLIPTGLQYYASNQTGSIYGVLDLQSWTTGNPPRDKSAIQ
ncbi:MAG: hypothetical protein LBS62_14965 [Clostridiales bacterium]|nr:hypothetical protein [Clostridiales bacterium]